MKLTVQSVKLDIYVIASDSVKLCIFE